ncbi:unnamed protein product [Phytophthora lilii]|uniref:Unnamed protein product n=1 Tax=Phytophthora lilii TaxID=2077276 RepID=A0A9W6WYJ1_9STRA|nr:unnamed protein product [Phytophthora lilii]
MVWNAENSYGIRSTGGLQKIHQIANTALSKSAPNRRGCSVVMLYSSLHDTIKFTTMARGRGWTTPETLYMLGLVEQLLPFGSNQWNAVQLEYNTNLPNGFSARDTDSIKRKFNALKNTRKPTGDPTCPADVAQAKRVFRLIEARCGVLVLDDSDTPV